MRMVENDDVVILICEPSIDHPNSGGRIVSVKINVVVEPVGQFWEAIKEMAFYLSS